MKFDHQVAMMTNQENNQVFQICEGTVHFEGQKEAIFRFQSCETMGSQLCPPPTIAYRQNGVGSTLDLRWSCIKNVL